MSINSNSGAALTPPASIATPSSAQVSVGSGSSRSHEKTPGHSQVFSSPSGLAQSGRSGGAPRQVPASAATEGLPPSPQASEPAPMLAGRNSPPPAHTESNLSMNELRKQRTAQWVERDAVPAAATHSKKMNAVSIEMAAQINPQLHALS
jgi:hypothetical protein